MRRKIIDILVSVVDNYGDMGFAVEFITAWRRELGDDIDFVIWTDNVEKMRKFVEKIAPHLIVPSELETESIKESVMCHSCRCRNPLSETRDSATSAEGQKQRDTYRMIKAIPILDIAHFGKLRKSEVALSLLHAPIPDASLFAPQSLVLRVDYLSFDLIWIAKNETEHIQSTDKHKIIELVQSPFPEGAGLLPPFPHFLTKDTLKKELSAYTTEYIDAKKDWITIFAYPDTLTRIDWATFSDEVQVFVFSKNEDSRFLGNDRDGKNIISLPLLPLELFHSFLANSTWSIVRGDMTGSLMLQFAKPYYWDIYREIGGVHHELSDAFLDFIGGTTAYRSVHHEINTSKKSKISYTDFVQGLRGMTFSHREIPNLLISLKKYIDRFYFSL